MIATRPKFDRNEAAGLALVAGVGLLLWTASTRYPAAMPVWGPWDFSWSVYLTAVFACWWYVRGVVRSAPSERPTFWRRVSYLAGVLTIYAVLQTRYEYMAQHTFVLDRIQHMVMHHLGPFLIALAWPGAVLRRGMPAPLCRITGNRHLLRAVRAVQQPAVAGFLFVGLLGFWLIPAIQLRAMLNPQLYMIMNWSMIIDGVLFWYLILDPRPGPPARIGFGARLLLIAATMFPQIAIGAFISLHSTTLYQFYDLCGRLFPALGDLSDQHFGGIVVWESGGSMSVLSFLIVLNRLRKHEERTALPVAPAATRGSQVAISSAAWTGR